MAKGIDVNGQLRGKRGGVVYYRANGEQISRAKAASVRNPRSARQAVQRMVLATSSKLTSALRPIVDHSFEGVAIGETSVRHFQSRAMRFLRNVAGVYLNEPSSVSTPADFALKGAPIIGGAQGIYISTGRLGMNGYEMVDGTTMKVVLSSELASITDAASYAAELAKLGIVPGDQLTFVTLSRNINVSVASFDNEQDFAQMARFCRVVFVSELPSNWTSGNLIVNGSFNPALIKESLGLLPIIDEGQTDVQFSFASVLESGYEIYLAALIRSQKQDNGKFYYSSAALVGSTEVFDENDAYPTYLSYMDGATVINVGDEKYLRHAVAAPFGQGE